MDGEAVFKNVTHKEFGISHQQLKTGMKFSVEVTGKMLDTINRKVIEKTPVLVLPGSFSCWIGIRDVHEEMNTS